MLACRYDILPPLHLNPISTTGAFITTCVKAGSRAVHVLPLQYTWRKGSARRHGDSHSHSCTINHHFSAATSRRVQDMPVVSTT